jgi:acyl-CoA thioester hydrolase
MDLNFSNTITIRVRYGETDRMGYCYYGNFAQYFEVGRVEALREIGFTYLDMENTGYLLPVSEFQVKYISPAFYDDLLFVNTNLIGISGPKLYFEYVIKNKEDKIICIASTTLVFVSKDTMKPISPPKDFLGALNQYKVE